MDMNLMFMFTNSYDKTTRFCIQSAAYIRQSQNVMTIDNSRYRRLHKGRGDVESYENIQRTIANARDTIDIFKQLKQSMMQQTLITEDFGRLLGELVIKKLITITQMSIAITNHKKSYFGLDKNNPWEVFNAISEAAMDGAIDKLQEKYTALQMYLYAKYCDFGQKTPNTIADTLF